MYRLKSYFETSDILTIHTKLSDRTEGFIDKEKLNLMKKDSDSS